MKKIFFVIAFLLTVSVFAQENNIKLGIGGIAMGDYSLSYERLITPKSTINANFGYLNLEWGALPVVSLSDISSDVKLNQIKSGLHSSIDYRFYAGKKDNLRGIYFAPYVRYWDYKFVMDDEIDGTIFDINTKVWSIGLGFQMGYQWLVSDKISIDWYFLGFGAEWLNTSAAYVTQNGSAFNYSTIEDDVLGVFDGFTFVEKRLTTEPVDDRLKINLPVWLPGVKTGISIGYAF
jgi:hypothetical protein